MIWWHLGSIVRAYDMMTSILTGLKFLKVKYGCPNPSITTYRKAFPIWRGIICTLQCVREGLWKVVGFGSSIWLSDEPFPWTLVVRRQLIFIVWRIYRWTETGMSNYWIIFFYPLLACNINHKYSSSLWIWCWRLGLESPHRGDYDI